MVGIWLALRGDMRLTGAWALAYTDATGRVVRMTDGWWPVVLYVRLTYAPQVGWRTRRLRRVE